MRQEFRVGASLRHCLISTWMVLICTVLAGCASKVAYREGQTLLAEGKYEQGIGKMEEAVRLDPKSVEYRIGLANYRASITARLVSEGEAAVRDGRLTDAEIAFRQAQSLDPHHAMVRQGLESITKERRHRLAVSEVETTLKKGSLADINEALAKLRPVLAENPSRKDAQALKTRIDEARQKFERPGTRLSSSFRKPVSLEFRDAPLRSVFDAMSQASGLNFFFDKDTRIDSKTTVLAKNTSIEDAVRLVLITNQLEQKVLNENSILIYPNTPQKLKDYQSLNVRTFYLANADVKAVSNTIKTIVKTKDMAIDERLGIIIIRDTPEAVRMAERIVALQDLSDPEVMLDVEVLEIKRSRLLDFGIQWPSQMTLSPMATASGQPITVESLRQLSRNTVSASIGGNLAINARKEDQDGNILANPRIRVRNKEKAKVLIGDRVPIITTTTSPATNANYVSEAVNYIDVGLKLEVEPTIYLDEEVAIKVNLEVSTLVREVLSKAGTLAYQIGTRSANTVLRLRDGETQILAGLISDEDRATSNMVPGLGELPVLGRLFGSQKDDSQRSEILLSITPRVLRSNRRPDLVDAEFESGTETSVGAEPLRLSVVEGTSVVPVASAAHSQRAATDSISTAGAPTAASGINPTPAQQSLIAHAEPSLQVAAPAPVANQSFAVGPSPSFSLQIPATVKVGQEFNALLLVRSESPLHGWHLQMAYDSQGLQVTRVEEGDLLRQQGGSVQFSPRIDAALGRIFVTAARQAGTDNDSGANVSGSVVKVTFKAVTPSDGPGQLIQLLSASTKPVTAAPISVPIQHVVRVLP